MVCKALASLDYMMLIQTTSFHYFNPQGSREPRRLVPSLQVCGPYISIHKALASLDVGLDAGDIDISRFQSTRLSQASTKTTFNPLYDITISIHKALASLDRNAKQMGQTVAEFQSTRLSRASTWMGFGCANRYKFQSTRLSRASTITSQIVSA